MRPKLTAILCNYNHGPLVGRAIESVVCQSCRPGQFIIVDDGSTDNSCAVIGSYARRYPFIDFTQLPRNTGGFGALGLAMQKVRGDYVYSASSDDYLLPDFFVNAMAMADLHPRAGIIFGKMVAVDPSGRELKEYGAPRWSQACAVSPKEYLEDYLEVIQPTESLSSSTIYRRAALEESGGFRPELGSWCDTFALRAIALKYGACYMPMRCAAWTQSPGSFSNSTGANPEKILDIAARTAWLMRSPEFRERFPEEHVRRWLAGFRELYIQRHVGRCKVAYNNVLGSLNHMWSWAGTMDRWMLRFILKWLRMEHRFLLWRIEHSLRAYSGDVSCYKQHPQPSSERLAG